MGFYHETVAWLTRLVRQPIGELTRAQRRVRYAIDLARHCARQLSRDRASHIAAALTYRTLFSLVPLAVMSMLVVRALVSRDQAKETALQQAYILFDVAGNGVLGPTDLDVRQRIQEIVIPIIDNAWSLNFGSIGAVGLLLLVWAALALLVTIENAFNTVYKAPTGRPWRTRVPVYWAVVTLGPLLLFFSFYVADLIFDFLMELGPVGVFLSRLSTFTALGAIWLLLVIVYSMMPTAKVHLRPAMMGALVAAILLEMGKHGFRLYVGGAVQNSVYGTLGLIPLFLLWLYISWLIVLFGLELSYAHQTLPRHRFRLAAVDEPVAGVWDPRWLLPLMAGIARAFAAGKTIGTESLARSMSIPIAAARQLVNHLLKAGLARRVDSDAGDEALEDALVPARPPDRITVAEVLDVAEQLALPPAASRAGAASGDWELMEQISQAQRQATAGRTLADLVGHGPAAPPQARARSEEEGAPGPAATRPGPDPSAAHTPRSDPAAEAASASGR